MERRYVKDGKRALTVLDCTEVESLKVANDHHLTALRPDGTRFYLRTYQELADAILALANLVHGR